MNLNICYTNLIITKNYLARSANLSEGLYIFLVFNWCYVPNGNGNLWDAGARICRPRKSKEGGKFDN